MKCKPIKIRYVCYNKWIKLPIQLASACWNHFEAHVLSRHRVYDAKAMIRVFITVNIRCILLQSIKFEEIFGSLSLVETNRFCPKIEPACIFAKYCTKNSWKCQMLTDSLCKILRRIISFILFMYLVEFSEHSSVVIKVDLLFVPRLCSIKYLVKYWYMMSEYNIKSVIV